MNMDFVTDNNPAPLFWVDRQLGIPEYVKQANVIQKEDIQDLNSAAFADPDNNLYPVHSKEATWLSAVWAFNNKEPKDGKCMTRLKNAARHYEIEEDIQHLEAVFDEKHAGEIVFQEPEFALEIDGESYYPVNDDEEVKSSSALMMNDFYAGRLPLEYLQKAAAVVADKADAYEVTIPQRLRRIGEKARPDFKHARKTAALRKEAGFGEKDMAMLNNILDSAEEAYRQNEDMTKWANLWGYLDEANGIDYRRHYTPYELLFNGLSQKEIDKVASENICIKNVLVPAEIFSSVPEKTWKKYFGKEAAEKLTKIASYAIEDAVSATANLENMSEYHDRILETLMNEK